MDPDTVDITTGGPDDPTNNGVPYTVVVNGSDEETVEDEKEDPELVSFRFAVHAVVVPILFAAITVVGLAGNSLVVYAVTTRRRLRTVTNLLLLNLDVADLCFVAVVPPFTAYEYVAGELPTSSWALGDVACRLLHYLVNVTAYVTVYTLAMIAAVRYATVVHGVRTARWRTRRNVVRAVVGLWCLVMAVNVPILLSYGVTVDATTGQADCDIADVATGRRVFATLFTFAYVLPLGVIAALSALILAHIARAQRSSLLLKQDESQHQRRTSSTVNAAASMRRKFGGGFRTLSMKMTGRAATVDEEEEGGGGAGGGEVCARDEVAVGSNASARSRSTRKPSCRKRQVTRLLVLVVVVFAILWLPIHVHLLLAFFYHVPQGSRVYVALSVLWNCLAYFNSCVNPIIYNHTSKDFRDAFRSVVQLCRCTQHGGLCGFRSRPGGGDRDEGMTLDAAVSSPNPPTRFLLQQQREQHPLQSQQPAGTNGCAAAAGGAGEQSVRSASAAAAAAEVDEPGDNYGDELVDDGDFSTDRRNTNLMVLGRLRPALPTGDRIAVPVVVQLQDPRSFIAGEANSYFSI